MKVHELKRKSKKRIDTSYLPQLGIQSYGVDNLYPQTLRNIIAASPIGAECVDRYAEFIEGNGFVDLAFAEMVINRYGDTADSLHADVCRDLAMFGGFALHISYNIFGKVAGVTHIPFESVRLMESNKSGDVRAVAIHPDWTGDATRDGKKVFITKENIDFLPMFDPRPSVVMREIAEAPSFREYGGQVFYYSNRGVRNYPISKADRVVTEMSTDEGLSNVRYRNTRNNFLPSALIVMRRGSAQMEEGGTAFTDQLSRLQGDENTGKMLVVEVGDAGEEPIVKTLASQNYDKEFSVTDDTTCERIYSAFGQDVWNAIRKGKVGFGGALVKDAFDYYNTLVERDRRVVERAFASIFAHWWEESERDYSVAPILYKAWT